MASVVRVKMNREEFYKHINREELPSYAILPSCERVYSAFEKQKSPPYNLVSLVHDFFKSFGIASNEVVLGAAMLSELPIKEINPSILGEYVMGEVLDAAKSDIKKKTVSKESIESSASNAQNFVHASLSPLYSDAPFIFESIVFWYAQSVVGLEEQIGKLSPDVSVYGDNILSHAKDDCRMNFFENKVYSLLLDYARRLEAQRAETVRLAEIEKEKKIAECKKQWVSAQGQRGVVYSDLEDLV